MKLKDALVFFDLPNMTAVFLDCSNRLYEATASYFIFKNFSQVKGVYSPTDYDLFIQILQQRVGSVIYAFLAFESFINDVIPEDYVYTNTKGEKRDKNYIAEKFSMEDKITLILQDIYGITKIDDKIYQKYKNTKDLRDRIMHLKEIDKRTSDVNEDTIRKVFMAKDFEHYALVIKQVI